MHRRVVFVFRDHLQKFRGAREKSTRHHAHSPELSQNPNAQPDTAMIAMGTPVSSEASAAPTPRDEERGGCSQTTMLLLNLALPIAEVFTPVKVIVGFLLESAKLLDKRNANLMAIKTIASRADDLIEALSTYAPEEGATSGGQLEASGILDKISQTLIRRISVIILRIKDLEKSGILRIEAVASALQDAKSGLDQCVEFAHIQLSLYHGKMMQGLALQMSSVQESCAITRRTLEALQPSIQKSVACKTFRFVDMTGREHHVPCGVAFAEENFTSFLKEVLFSGQDTLSVLHKSLLQNTEDSIEIHSFTPGHPVDEETLLCMKVKRKLKSLKVVCQVSLQAEAPTVKIEARSTPQILHLMEVTVSIPDPTIDDILDNPLIHKNHIVDALTCKTNVVLAGQLQEHSSSGHPYLAYFGDAIVEQTLYTIRGKHERSGLWNNSTVTCQQGFNPGTWHQLELEHGVDREALSLLLQFLADVWSTLLLKFEMDPPDVLQCIYIGGMFPDLHVGQEAPLEHKRYRVQANRHSMVELS